MDIQTIKLFYNIIYFAYLFESRYGLIAHSGFLYKKFTHYRKSYGCRSPPLCSLFLSNYKGQGESMKNKYRVPDFRSIYPEASEEVIELLRQTERKMQYQEYDLKTEKYEINQKEETIICIPSREDSLERLLELDCQFMKEQPSVEDEVIRNIMYEKLHNAMQILNREERELIIQSYFQEQSEREIALQMGLSQKAVNKRKHMILMKLQKIIKKI